MVAEAESVTQDEFCALTRRVSFGAGLICWNPQVRAVPLVDGGVRVEIEKWVPHRDVTVPLAALEADLRSGAIDPRQVLGVFGSSYFLSAAQLARADENAARARLLFFVRDSMVHEVDESIRFDGALARDEHLGETP